MKTEIEIGVECAIVNLLFAQSEIAEHGGSMARAMAHINDAIAELRPFAARRQKPRARPLDPAAPTSPCGMRGL